MRILLVEDDKDLALTIKDELGSSYIVEIATKTGIALPPNSLIAILKAIKVADGNKGKTINISTVGMGVEHGLSTIEKRLKSEGIQIISTLENRAKS